MINPVKITNFCDKSKVGHDISHRNCEKTGERRTATGARGATQNDSTADAVESTDRSLRSSRKGIRKAAGGYYSQTMKLA